MQNYNLFFNEVVDFRDGVIIMLLVLVVWSILFCSIVSQKTVKRNVFDYAKTLLETVDVMSGDLEA